MKMIFLISIIFVGFVASAAATGFDVTTVSCDNKSVEKMARLAITYINEDRETGYKFALNRISNVLLSNQGPSGKVYYLDLDVLETKCHVLSPKSWKRCDVRPFMETQVSGSCNTTVLLSPEGFTYLHSYDCTLVPDSPERLLQICPLCPLLLAPSGDLAQSSAKAALLQYNRQSTLPISLSLGTVTRASHQVTPVPTTFVEFMLQECSAPATQELLCAPEHVGKEPIGFCVGMMSGASGVAEVAGVSCEIFRPQRFGMSVKVKPQVHSLAPPLHRETSVTAGAAPLPDFQPVGPVGTARDVDLEGPGLVDPVRRVTVPEASLPPPQGPAPPAASSESGSSSESESASSEEGCGSVQVIRPPANFRYVAHRQRRQAPPDTAPPRPPVFMSVFPSVPSPFRSCPGVARYTTV